MRPTGTVDAQGATVSATQHHVPNMSSHSFCIADDLLETHLRELFESEPGPEVTLAWQGEPTLVGLDDFRLAIDGIQNYSRSGVHVEHTIQTDGAELTSEWCEFFRQHNFLVGLRLDGPREIDELYALDHTGRPVFDIVVRAARLMKMHQVDFNVLASVHAGNGDHPLEMYHFLRDEIGTRFIQLIPIVEHWSDATLSLKDLKWRRRAVRPLDIEQAFLADAGPIRSDQWGRFLIGIFDDWIRRDVGRVFVEMFDAALASWVGTETMSRYACGSRRAHPKSRFIARLNSEPGLSELCAGYQTFFEHVDRPMRIMADLLRQGRDPAEVVGFINAAPPPALVPSRRSPRALEKHVMR
jgi:uncharacterized protein